MKIYLKEVVYFEIDVKDGTDRSRITESFSQVISPQFEELLGKLKFDESDEKAFEKLTGNFVKLNLLSKNQFIKKTASDKKFL